MSETTRDNLEVATFVVRQFEGTPWVPLHEAARLHDAVQDAGLTIASLRNSLAIEIHRNRALDAETHRLRAVEHAARDVDGLWTEARMLIHWEQEAGEALRDLRDAIAVVGAGVES